jgi:hypothetical protein
MMSRFRNLELEAPKRRVRSFGLQRGIISHCYYDRPLRIVAGVLLAMAMLWFVIALVRQLGIPPPPRPRVTVMSDEGNHEGGLTEDETHVFEVSPDGQINEPAPRLASPWDDPPELSGSLR